MSDERNQLTFAERIDQKQTFSKTDILKVVSFAGLGCVLMNLAQNYGVSRRPVNAASEVVSSLFEKIPYVSHENARIAGREVLDLVFMVTPFLGAVVGSGFMRERNWHVPGVSDLLDKVAGHGKGR